MNRLDERKIIEIFQNILGNKKFVSEDVEEFEAGKGLCVVKLDTLVESTDIPPRSKLQDMARKSIVSCISDFAAKGIRPSYGVISITLPKKISKSKIQQLARGFQKAEKECSFKIIGGDTNQGKELVIQVFLIGFGKKIVQRKGAKENDIIITSGPFGYTAAGLKILLEKKKANKKFERKVTKAVFSPLPKLEFGVSNARHFTSSMDSSDGLSTTLVEMAKQSKKRFVITNLPVGEDLFNFAKKNRISSLDLVLNGGEEYEIVATIRPKDLQAIKKNAKKLKVPLYEIGFVSDGKGVFYQKEESLLEIKDRGWVHFKKR